MIRLSTSSRFGKLKVPEGRNYDTLKWKEIKVLTCGILEIANKTYPIIGQASDVETPNVSSLVFTDSIVYIKSYLDQKALKSRSEISDARHY